MTNKNDLMERIQAIETRKNSATLDKAWETSLTRKLGIMLFTYFAVLSYLFLIKNHNP